MPARLEALGLLGGIPRAALHAMVVAALRVVIHLRRDAAGRRVLTEICVLARHPAQHTAAVVTAWRAGTGPGPGFADLQKLLAGHIPVPEDLRPRWRYNAQRGWL